jgi:hypothetical protein
MVHIHLDTHYFIPKAFIKPLCCARFQEFSGGELMIQRLKMAQGEPKEKCGMSGDRR